MRAEPSHANAATWLLRAAAAMLPFAWLSTQVPAVIWALLCTAGAVAVFGRTHSPLPSTGSAAPDAAPLAALRALIAGAAVATALIAVAVFAHRDELRFVRQELKPLLLFLAVTAWSRRSRLDPLTARLLDAGLILGLFAAPVLAGVVERDRIPGNAVPWATAVAAGVCAVMPRALLAETSASWRTAGVLAGLAGLAAIALSQTRAALWVLPWLAALAIVTPTRGRRRVAVAIGLLAVIVGAWVWLQPLDPTSRTRLAEAVREVEQFRRDGTTDTSVGSRLALWESTVRRIGESTRTILLGHGSRERAQLIAQAAQSHSSPHLAGLTHLHNQYLNSLFDFGLAGLSAVTASLVALVVAARRSAGEAGRVCRWQLGGIALMQATGFLTNANGLHGHYVFAVSLMVVLSLMPRAPAGRDDVGQSARCGSRLGDPRRP